VFGFVERRDIPFGWLLSLFEVGYTYLFNVSIKNKRVWIYLKAN